MDLTRFSAVLLDLDGTIYHDEHPLPEAIAFVHRLQRRGQKFACLTNGNSSPSRYQRRLARMGVKMDAGHIYSAAAAAADYVLLHARRGRMPRVYNLAGRGAKELLDGKVVWVSGADQKCDVVVCGTMNDVFATAPRRLIALQLLRHGAMLLGMCADRIFPSKNGIVFGSGAFAHFMGYAADVTPIFTGKPEAIFFQELCARLKVRPRQCVLIGDNLESDIAGAKRLGMATVLTLTGITGRQRLAKTTPETRPDQVVENLGQLT